MTRKTNCIIAALVAVLLTGFSARSQAQTVASNAVYGAGASSMRVYANGYYSNGAPAGYFWYELASGVNFTGRWASLTFSTSGSVDTAVGTARGYLYGPGGVRLGAVSVTLTLNYNTVTGVGTAEVLTGGIFGWSYAFDSGALGRAAGQMLITN